jgi:hypothetical protein
MAASSVTGVGIGESNGKQKRNNNASCGGGTADAEEAAKKKVIKNGCHISYNVRGYGSYKTGQSKSIRVC